MVHGRAIGGSGCGGGCGDATTLLTSMAMYKKTDKTVYAYLYTDCNCWVSWVSDHPN